MIAQNTNFLQRIERYRSIRKDPRLDQFFAYCDQYVGQKTLIVALSGGADSMLVLHAIAVWLIERGQSLNQIVVVHADHGYRQDSADCAQFLLQYCEGMSYHTDRYSGTHTENHRRKRRKQLIASISNTTIDSLIVTGHHLTDRFETTMLNIARGCHRKGLRAFGVFDGRVLRPLIDYPKYRIHEIVAERHIPVWHDTTNDDPHLSARNRLRAYFSGSDQIFWQQVSDFYHFLPVVQKVLSYEWYKPDFIGAQQFCRIGYDGLWSRDMTVECWDELAIYRDITRCVLDEFGRFVDTCSSGYFCVRGRYFVKAHGQLYAIKTLHGLGKEKKSDEFSVEGDRLRCGSVVYDLPQSARGQIICFPHTNCYYRGRKLSRWFIDHKIPFFVRDRVPVAGHRKNDQIFEVERIGWQQTLNYCFDLLS